MMMYWSFRSIPEVDDIPEVRAKVLLKRAWKNSTRSRRFYGGLIVAGFCAGAFSWISGCFGGELYGIIGGGVGWGLSAKGLGIRVVTPDGVPIYFDPKDEKIRSEFHRWHGRLIEVTGTLRKREMMRAGEGTQGYTNNFEYLAVENALISKLEKTERSLRPKADQDDDAN